MKPVFNYLLLCLLLTSIHGISQNIDDWTFGNALKMRHANKVTMNQGRIFLVGGWESNDAISTIYYSDDTCRNWYLAIDIVNAWLQDISFANYDIAYSVGASGTILKSEDHGSTWNSLSLSGNLTGRNYHGVHFFNENTGIAVGGNESNDAIQTIIKTNDGGATWNIVADNMAPMLRDIFFVNNQLGFVCGDNGTILKTTDAGDNWTDISLSGNLQNRRFNSIYFYNEDHGVIVGGYPSNDSIQTIIKTSNGGTDWSIISDQVDHMLNGVTAYNDQTLFAVGNYGEFIKSEDMGGSWTDYHIESNDTVNLNDIYFKDEIMGLVGGNYAKFGLYNGVTGELASSLLEEPVMVLTPSSVRINGFVNPNGAETDAFFEYGEGNAFDHSVSLFDNVLIGEENISFEKIISGLEENRKYNGRIKTTNLHGESYSNNITFFTGLGYIPNFSFENWSEIITSLPADWGHSGGVSQIDSYDGSKAAYLHYKDEDGGAIFFGNPGDNGLYSGTPFTSRPDSVSLWLNYNVADMDTAYVIAILKKSDESMISSNFHQIYGSSNDQFVNVKFKIDYLNLEQPEILFLGITSTNLLSDQINPESYLSVDNILFINSDDQVPNQNLESWVDESEFILNNWYNRNDHTNTDEMVEQNSNSFSGNYALKLSTIFSDANKQFAQISTYPILDQRGPSFPVYANVEKFYFYYQFYPQDNDSLYVEIELYSNGIMIGNGFQKFSETISDFTLQEIPLNYYGMETADSASIYFTIAKNNWQGDPGDSYAIIDNLSFDAIIQPQGIEETYISSNEAFIMFPNPVNNQFNIKFVNEEIGGDSELKIFNISGQALYTENIFIIPNEILQVDISNLKPQILIISIQSNNKMYINKLIKR